MEQPLSFIETQFPVSKISKESYKERKAVQSQTLTGLGKWWGRKPLILVRAAILGCLMPAGNNPKKDTEIFLKILSMDEKGLELRKEKKFTAAELYRRVFADRKLSKYRPYFDLTGTNPRIDRAAPRDEIEMAVFRTLGYDEKIAMCKRPEHVEVTDPHTWNEINHHLGTSARSLQELVKQLSLQKYGHKVVVGDCFCGGGSIPFEAARIGCDAYGSDLNPVAALLSKMSLDLLGTDQQKRERIKLFQADVYKQADQQIAALGVEHNDAGDRADAYLYCMETVCPECGYRVPMAPGWILGGGSKSVVSLAEDKANASYHFHVSMNVSAAEMKAAKEAATIADNNLLCPHCGRRTPISAIRHDTVDNEGNAQSGLRIWDKSEFTAREKDTFQERLYAVRYVKEDGKRYYQSPGERERRNEDKIASFLEKHIAAWQAQGFIPSAEIIEGYKTNELIRNRGWKYWHHLFNPRQLLLHGLLQKAAFELAGDDMELAASVLGLNRCCDWNSALCRWGVGQARESMAQTFYNQAFNTMWNHGARGLTLLKGIYFLNFEGIPYCKESTYQIAPCDARVVKRMCDIWITDPPYADAVNYHELSEFFLAWDRKPLMQSFPDWYADSKRVLAVRGDAHFSRTMIEIYENMTVHMSENGMQVVMFTHSDPAVWAQLAVIMWKAGLKVTAAWNIATETDASGLKNGNYIKGTVLLVLRKQTGDDIAFLDEINADIQAEVRRQIAGMQALDDKEEPNFADPDYVLAAYAASLKVLTAYASIEDLDLEYELNQAISNPRASKIVRMIEHAKKIAFDCVIPSAFPAVLWREMTNAEKFYIKGLESEKRGEYQLSAYQEFARGFSISGYSRMMASEHANAARLKTPFEMAGRTIRDVPDFENSVMRTIFHGIYVGIKEEMSPQKALGFIKNELPDYWGRREMIRKILAFFVDVRDRGNMHPHWTESAEMAELLLSAVTHDGV